MLLNASAWTHVIQALYNSMCDRALNESRLACLPQCACQHVHSFDAFGLVRDLPCASVLFVAVGKSGELCQAAGQQ